MPPLRVHPGNPRYFQDGEGRAVYLAGSHHWDNLVDNDERPGGFDFEGYLSSLVSWGHNFIRLWAHEAWLVDLQPRPWLRTGPGLALDGRPRFDLTRFDPEYFARLRWRVLRAAERGPLYVSVMLFNGWSIHDKGEGNPWGNHPFNRRNNVNGVDGDPDDRGDGTAVHSLRVPAVTRLQELYVRQVVETVGDLDNVLWEISNESPGASREWQYFVIRFLKNLETSPDRQHPVGMTFAFPGGRNRDLLRSPADWISPGNRGGWRRSPPPADGAKVVAVDTDHLWGIGGDRAWVWKTFLRGHHTFYMDPLDDDPVRQAARQAMGDTVRWSRRLNLEACRPRVNLCSSGYALANEQPGEVLAYLPRGWGWIRLGWLPGPLRLEWFDPVKGQSVDGGTMTGGGIRWLSAPWRGEAVVFLTRIP
jgi:hypothetical protein